MSQKIILTGYMGVGKSTIGRHLAAKLQLTFIDLDSYIEEKYQLPISEIFQTKGEIFFRKQEHLALLELVDSPQSMIISLGGGTPCYANNHLLLQREDVASFYLKSNVKELVKRLQKSKKKRPLLQSVDDLYSFVGSHLLERNYFYSFAKHTVNADRPIPVIVDELFHFLQ